jgi:hypothetical protein
MKKVLDRGRGSLDLLEEAVHLLRQTSVQVLFLYYIGSFPWILGLLYFWADMSRGPFAHRYIAEAAFGLALLFVWMKCWQSVFCARLHSHLLGKFADKYSLKRIWNLVSAQAILQPLSLILLPIAFLILLPFGWTFAFFQNLLIIGSGSDSDLRKVRRTSWRLAALWPAQNHRMLLVLTVFTFVVLINVAVLMIMVPLLFRMLLGIETIFTLSGMHIFNTTFVAVAFAFTYLCVDPLITAVYTLRCFYGESIESGADLLSELKSLPKAS